MQVLHCPNFRSKAKKFEPKRQVRCGNVLLFVEDSMMSTDFRVVVPCKACRGKLVELKVKDGLATTRTLEIDEVEYGKKIYYIPQTIVCQNV
jgi:hypothetical protein